MHLALEFLGPIVKQIAYDRVRDILLEEVAGFAASVEYERLEEDNLSNVPGLVAAAFTRFLNRFQQEEIARGLSARDAKALEDAYRAIELLSSSNDESVLNLVQIEIFENIRGSPELFHIFESKLGRLSRERYEDWRARNA
jgi:hypothetical protein